MERHLELRAQRLRALAEHLRATYKPLSFETRWSLLQDAERLEAARGIWINYDERVSREAVVDGILAHTIIQYMLNQRESDESDAVRLWFQRHVPDVGRLMQCVKSATMEKSARGRRDLIAIAATVGEANDIVLSGIQSAFDFRINSAGLYGFDGLIDEKGILIDATDFPDPWASPLDFLQAVDDQHQHSIKLIEGLWGPNMKKGKNTIEKVALQIEELAELLCRLFLERIRWLEQRSEQDEVLPIVRERYEKERGGWVKPLVGLGRTDAAYAIAEKYQDFRTLVELASAELIQVETTSTDNLDEDQRLMLSQQKDDAIKRIEVYLDRFRSPFATELYKYQIENGRFQELLENFPNFQAYLTKFLHSSNNYTKLAWIHDVGLQEYGQAGDTLVHIAQNQEDTLWNKKVELSIGKLCKLAALPDHEAIEALGRFNQWQNETLTVIQIQEQVYDFLQPFVRGAIDKEAEVDIALKEKGNGVSKRLVTKNLFTSALNLLFNHKTIEPELLIDLLTLMDKSDDPFPRFYLALETLKMARLPSDRKSLAEQSIWRRCYIQDKYV